MGWLRLLGDRDVGDSNMVEVLEVERKGRCWQGQDGRMVMRMRVETEIW